MRYIPPHERDTRYPLWCVNYACRVPWNEMRTVEDIEMFGVPFTGDVTTDRETATELRDIQIPVERMAELLASGARVLLRDPHIKAKIIYHDIMDHIQAWSSRMNFSVNLPNIPRDDLRMFDDLANALWPMTQATMPTDYSNGSFAALIRKHGGADRRQQLAELFPEAIKDQKDAMRNQERKRMSDYFKVR